MRKFATTGEWAEKLPRSWRDTHTNTRANIFHTINKDDNLFVRKWARNRFSSVLYYFLSLSLGLSLSFSSCTRAHRKLIFHLIDEILAVTVCFCMLSRAARPTNYKQDVSMHREKPTSEAIRPSRSKVLSENSRWVVSVCKFMCLQCPRNLKCIEVCHTALVLIWNRALANLYHRFHKNSLYSTCLAHLMCSFFSFHSWRRYVKYSLACLARRLIPKAVHSVRDHRFNIFITQ